MVVHDESSRNEKDWLKAFLLQFPVRFHRNMAEKFPKSLGWHKKRVEGKLKSPQGVKPDMIK